MIILLENPESGLAGGADADNNNSDVGDYKENIISRDLGGNVGNVVSKLDLKCENMNSNVLCNKGLSFNSHNSIFGLSFSNGLINYNKGVLGGLLLGCGVLNKFNSNTNKFGCRFYSTTSGEISHNADDFVNDLKS